MDTILGLALFIWICGAMFAFVMSATGLEGFPGSTPNARAVVLIGVVAFAPAIVAVGIPLAVGYALWYVSVGIRDLWRDLFPPRVKVPRAKVVKP